DQPWAPMVSPLSPEECSERLREAIYRSSDLGSRTFMLGRVRGRTIKLSPRRAGTAFRFRGVLDPHGNGTRVRGAMQLHPLSRFGIAGTVAMALIAAAFGIVMLGSSIWHYTAPEEIRTSFIPTVIVAGGSALWFLAAFPLAHRRDSARVTSYLVRELDAVP